MRSSIGLACVRLLATQLVQLPVCVLESGFSVHQCMHCAVHSVYVMFYLTIFMCTQV
jgi:hypothetical protein